MWTTFETFQGFRELVFLLSQKAFYASPDELICIPQGTVDLFCGMISCHFGMTKIKFRADD